MKNTANKTINFKQKDSSEKNKQSKYKISNTNSFKVIPYPKYKRKKEHSLELLKNNKKLLIILGLLLFFGLIFFLDNVVLKNKINSNSQSMSKPMSNTRNFSSKVVSEQEFLSYSAIIQNKVKSIFDVDSKNVSTDTMHKNGEMIYAQGSILDTNKKLYFDMVLESKEVNSLIIDGEEYIKKQNKIFC